MKRTRVLVITAQYAPDFGPSAPIYTALCEDLAQLGYDVTVVTGFPHYGGSNAYYHSPKRPIVEEWINDVRVIRSFVYTIPKSTLWLRLLYHASFNLSSTLAAVGVKRPDIVLADAPTLWSGLPLLVKSILPGIPFIYIVHDIYPDVLVRLEVLKNPGLISFIEKIENCGFLYSRTFHQISPPLSTLIESENEFVFIVLSECTKCCYDIICVVRQSTNINLTTQQRLLGLVFVY